MPTDRGTCAVYVLQHRANRKKLPCNEECGCLILCLGGTKYQPKKGANMPHAIVIGANGRRHEVDFEDAEVTIEVFAGETTIEIVIRVAK